MILPLGVAILFLPNPLLSSNSLLTRSGMDGLGVLRGLLCQLTYVQIIGLNASKSHCPESTLIY